MIIYQVKSIMLKMKKYLLPVIMLAIFETVAVTLWLTMDNLFYLSNFSYIGISIALGIFLFIRKYKKHGGLHNCLWGFIC